MLNVAMRYLSPFLALMAGQIYSDIGVLVEADETLFFTYGTLIIGVRHPMIRQTSQGAMGGSFNTREFFHHQTDTRVKAVKWFFIVMVFVLPVALLILGVSQDSTPVFVLAFTVQYTGLLAERWYFFAQARHPQNIYYAAT